MSLYVKWAPLQIFDSTVCVPVSLQVMTEEDKHDPLYPLYIGPEKLLSLYSENNWGNFCLSYLLTNRDYSGVLGLAWEGKAGESDLLWHMHK